MIKKLCLGIGLAGIVSHASATVIFADDFGTGSNAGNLTNIGPNWNVTTGQVDLWNFFSGKGYSIDLDGSGTNGTIETAMTFDFSPGNLYELSFNLSNNTNSGNVLNYSIGSLFNETLPTSLTGLPTFVTITKQFSVASNISATLSFAEQGVPDFGGSVIDDVMLQDLGSISVSEPSLFASLFLGLAGMGFSKRLKRKSAEAATQ